MPCETFQEKNRSVAQVTDVGKQRKNNEDALLVMNESGCYAVSDGMGGGSAGEIASSTVVTFIRNTLDSTPILPEARKENLSAAVYAANTAIAAYSEKRGYRSMGATIVVLLLNPWIPGKANLYFAGDSRIYRVRKGRIECLSSDHTVASAAGISESRLPDYMRGVLSNAVGLKDNFFLASAETAVEKGDIFLLCSDGLYRQIPEAVLASDLAGTADLRQILEAWVRTANEAQGLDNLSAIAVRFNSIPEPYSPTAEEIAANDSPEVNNRIGQLSETELPDENLEDTKI